MPQESLYEPVVHVPGSSTPSNPAKGAGDAFDEAGRVLAGWRSTSLESWSNVRVSKLLRTGGDGCVFKPTLALHSNAYAWNRALARSVHSSDFALALAALVHSRGGKVQLLHYCEDETDSHLVNSGSTRRCRLVAEIRCGHDVRKAAHWIGKRIALALNQDTIDTAVAPNLQ